ncbi:dephospho-CoA kinase [Psittacicella melopsittaci]|uniref:Dephospho-CoA kinase n=1 Tax=Psittacicella melopsittaci TaxID=2028576 RepID=A0A3A1Y5G6_9GAMM|nr:dephospho-CoA kinase [Psittacicella melopsittaci]RIY32448.1 dephospho-CoA kinase [Psittacicella melopsittaci]
MRLNKPIIGLTGGIASGKSTVANIFRNIGDCDIISSDDVSREVMQPGHPCYDEVVKTFGEGILLPEDSTGQRPIDRKALRSLVFGTSEQAKENLALLESITHPHIRSRELELFSKSEKDYILWDVPLLIEKKLWSYCDEIIVVQANRQTQIQRALERDPTTNLKIIVDILNAQASNQEREKHAKYVIVNDDTVTIKELSQKVGRVNNLIMEGTVKRFRRNLMNLKS